MAPEKSGKANREAAHLMGQHTTTGRGGPTNPRESKGLEEPRDDRLPPIQDKTGSSTAVGRATGAAGVTAGKEATATTKANGGVDSHRWLLQRGANARRGDDPRPQAQSGSDAKSRTNFERSDLAKRDRPLRESHRQRFRLGHHPDSAPLDRPARMLRAARLQKTLLGGADRRLEAR
jgi:hypothetical protein